ncbi:MAG: CHAD domain-containing protein [Polyangiaceae bacterium]
MGSARTKKGSTERERLERRERTTTRRSPRSALFPVRRVGPFLKGKLEELDRELAETVPRVVGGTDPEAIHDMRVAIRRLRTILKIARPVYGRFLADAVRGAFTEVHRATGTLRDEEVLDETLASLSVKSPEFETWKRGRSIRERRLRRVVIRALRSGDVDGARKLLEALLALPVKPTRDKELLKFARTTVDAARLHVEEGLVASPDDAEALHDLRIRFKHLRYVAEIFGDALPPDLAELAKSAAVFQKRLGEIHDIDVAVDTLERSRALHPDGRTLLLRGLAALRRAAILKYLRARADSGDTSAIGKKRAPASRRTPGLRGAAAGKGGGRSRRTS